MVVGKCSCGSVEIMSIYILQGSLAPRGSAQPVTGETTASGCSDPETSASTEPASSPVGWMAAMLPTLTHYLPYFWCS